MPREAESQQGVQLCVVTLWTWIIQSQGETPEYTWRKIMPRNVNAHHTSFLAVLAAETFVLPITAEFYHPSPPRTLDSTYTPIATDSQVTIQKRTISFPALQPRHLRKRHTYSHNLPPKTEVMPSNKGKILWTKHRRKPTCQFWGKYKAGKKPIF